MPLRNTVPQRNTVREQHSDACECKGRPGSAVFALLRRWPEKISGPAGQASEQLGKIHVVFSPSLVSETAHGSRGHDARTRDLVLRAVIERGPLTAAALAEVLGVTATAVRRHLDALEAAGEIRLAPAHDVRRGPGRPARAYVGGDLAGAVDRAGLATAYDHVATEALRFLAEQAGPQAVEAFAKRRVAGLEERYGDVVRAVGPDAMDRARALAKALADDGFAATARPVGPMLPIAPADPAAPSGAAAHHSVQPAADGTHSHVSTTGVQLCQGHCPVQQVAAEFPQFCEAETEAFARLLGVHVQRLATLAGGGHVCTTYVPNAPPHEPDRVRHSAGPDRPHGHTHGHPHDLPHEPQEGSEA